VNFKQVGSRVSITAPRKVFLKPEVDKKRSKADKGYDSGLFRKE